MNRTLSFVSRIADAGEGRSSTTLGVVRPRRARRATMVSISRFVLAIPTCVTRVAIARSSRGAVTRVPALGVGTTCATGARVGPTGALVDIIAVRARKRIPTVAAAAILGGREQVRASLLTRGVHRTFVDVGTAGGEATARVSGPASTRVRTQRVVAHGVDVTRTEEGALVRVDADTVGAFEPSVAFALGLGVARATAAADHPIGVHGTLHVTLRPPIGRVTNARVTVCARTAASFPAARAMGATQRERVAATAVGLSRPSMRTRALPRRCTA